MGYAQWNGGNERIRDEVVLLETSLRSSALSTAAKNVGGAVVAAEKGCNRMVENVGTTYVRDGADSIAEPDL